MTPNLLILLPIFPKFIGGGVHRYNSLGWPLHRRYLQQRDKGREETGKEGGEGGDGPGYKLTDSINKEGSIDRTERTVPT